MGDYNNCHSCVNNTEIISKSRLFQQRFKILKSCVIEIVILAGVQYDPSSCNSLPKNKILDWTKMKAFAEENINVALTLYYMILTFNDPEKKPFENNMEKGENAGNQHFLLFPTMFSSLPKSNLKF